MMFTASGVSDVNLNRTTQELCRCCEQCWQFPLIVYRRRNFMPCSCNAVATERRGVIRCEFSVDEWIQWIRYRPVENDRILSFVAERIWALPSNDGSAHHFSHCIAEGASNLAIYGSDRLNETIFIFRFNKRLIKGRSEACFITWVL